VLKYSREEGVRRWVLKDEGEGEEEEDEAKGT